MPYKNLLIKHVFYFKIIPQPKKRAKNVSFFAEKGCFLTYLEPMKNIKNTLLPFQGREDRPKGIQYPPKLGFRMEA